MSRYQLHKLSEAIRLGYRTKSNGERVLLSPQVANDFLMRIKAFQAKRGTLVYVSKKPSFTHDLLGHKFSHFVSYGPAIRTAEGYKPMFA